LMKNTIYSSRIGQIWEQRCARRNKKPGRSSARFAS